jgi:hypothetical protein
MRLIPLVVAALLVGGPASAQEPPASPARGAQSPAEDGATPTLPVSLDRIREGLNQPVDEPSLRSLSERADFIVTIQEDVKDRTTFQKSLETIDVSGGPTPAGGLYAYEQQRVLSRMNRPYEFQPLAGFSSGELLQVAITSALSRLFGTQLANMFGELSRTGAERAAHEQVERAVAEYCARQPNGGDGIAICSTR